jgi:hypothetical protein
MIDFFHDDGQYLALFSLLFRNTPSEVYLDKLHLSFTAASSEFREDELHQFVPLFLHVLEGG